MTAQPTFTPGPWGIVAKGDDYEIGSGTWDATEGAFDDYQIATAWGGYDNRANARLIAAAPDMAGATPRAAEMLRVAATFLREERPKGTAFYDGAICDASCIADDCEAAADDIDAALAKARGEA